MATASPPALAKASVPTQLSAKESTAFRQALQSIKKSDWGRFRRSFRKVKNPLAVKTLKWLEYQRSNRQPEFFRLSSFLNQTTNWPLHNKLRRIAETVMPANISTSDALRYFERYPALSPDGQAQLVRALLASGKKQSAIEQIKKTWVNGNFTKARENQFYKRYRKYLTATDHKRRMENLLWKGKYYPVRRMMWKVPVEYRKLAEARISLRVRRGNVDKLVANVPVKYAGDSGLLYERLRWRRRKNKSNAVDLVARIPDDAPYPEKWWIELSVLARKALNKGYITDAYRLVTKHNLTGGKHYAEAEWLAGWIAHSFLKDYEVALRHFQNLYSAVRYPVSLARGAYWTARSHQMLGDDVASTTWFSVAAQHKNTYYGQLASLELGNQAVLKLPQEPRATSQQINRINNLELVKVIRLLKQHGGEMYLKSLLLHVNKIEPSPGWRAQTAIIAREVGRYDVSVTIAKRASRDGILMPVSGYPVIKLPGNHKRAKYPQPELPLLLALIRQESLFQTTAQSHAKARGMMQLMPATARKISKRLRLRFNRKKLLTNPSYNITLGQTYLSEMLSKYEGSYILSLAAYNAGPKRSNRWIKDFGDPRDPQIDAIDWVEMIPFSETRNYVQRILENLQIYRSRLTKSEVFLQLAKDIHQ